MKRMLQRYCLLILVLGMFFSAAAQQKKIVQFSGLITSVGGELPVPYVTVTNVSFQKQAYAANHEGFFSFVAHVGDTIAFSSVGFEGLTFVIPHTASDKYTAKVSMKSMVIELPAATPFPWASVEEFNLAFMALDLGADDVLLAQKNLDPRALAALAQLVPRSAEEIQAYNSLQNHTRLINKTTNQRFANPLLNPFAWGSLINSIAKGDYSRQKLKY